MRVSWTKLDPGLVEEIVRRADQGTDRTSLAIEFGVSRALIDHHIRKRTGPTRRGKLSPEDRQEIIRRWRQGEVAAHLAKEFGVGFSAVAKLIQQQTGQRIGRMRRTNEIRIPTEPARLAYLAALIDAEGCITRNTKRETCTWQVVITNTSSELEDWLRPIGGNFYYVSRQRRDRAGNIKQCFEWKVTTAWNIHRLLTALLPYLVIKQERAFEALCDISRRLGLSPPSRPQLVSEDQLDLWV